MSILFAGDFFYSKDKEPVIIHKNLQAAICRSSEFVVNLEGPIVKGKFNGISKVGPIKIQSKEALDVLRKMGVTSVMLANNHIMDAGIGGLENTIKCLNEYKLSFFGIEKNYPLIRMNVSGKKISIIAAAEEEFNSLSEFGRAGSCLIDAVNLWGLVKSEQENGYDVVMCLHGGVEYQHIPPPWLRKMCHWLIDLDVRAVITHHPHVPSSVEVYKGRPIAWSLGNFWFPGNKNSFVGCMGYVFELSYVQDDNLDWNVYPYFIDYNKGVIREMNDKEASKWKSLIYDVSHILNNKREYERWWLNFIKQKSNTYQIKYSLAALNRIIAQLTIKISNYFSRDVSWKRRQLNGLRCRSHREIWIEALKMSRNINTKK